MVPIRRPRGSLPSSPIPGSDEVANLSLIEVRDRLARNARVLSSSLFSPSTSPASASILQAQTQAGPSRDPVREKLVHTREALLARESELLSQGMEGMSVSVKQEDLSGSPVSVKGTYMTEGRRGSGGLQSGRGSGKQRALETIRQGEAGLATNAIQLPIDQTLSLGTRDYTTQTLDTFNHLSLTKTLKPQTHDPLDENARAQHLARMNNFMSYKAQEDSDDDGGGGDMFGFEDGEYEGDDDRLASTSGARGTGERIDEFGEDEEVWREGVGEEYTLRGDDLDNS